MRKLKILANGETAVFFLWRLLFLTNLSCKDDEVGERRSHCKLAWCWPAWVAKMMKLEGDDRTASWLDVDQPDSSNNEDVCCRLLLGKLGKITMLRDPPLPPLWDFFLIFTQYFLLEEWKRAKSRKKGLRENWAVYWAMYDIKSKIQTQVKRERCKKIFHHWWVLLHTYISSFLRGGEGWGQV